MQTLLNGLSHAYPDQFKMNQLQESTAKLKGKIVTQPVDRFIDRTESMCMLFQYSSYVLEYEIVPSQNKIPMAIVYGAPGSGKTELFLQLMENYEHWYNQAMEQDAATSTANPFLFLPTPHIEQAEPSQCMPLAVTLNNQTSICNIEIKLSFGLSTMLAFRLFFLWFTSFDNYEAFLTFLVTYSETVKGGMGQIRLLVSFTEVVRMICKLHGKTRCIVTVDETIKYHDNVHSGDTKFETLVGDINTIVNKQSSASSEKIGIAVIFSSSCIAPFEEERSSSRRSLYKVHLPMLNTEHVTEKLFMPLLQEMKVSETLVGQFNNNEE